MELANFFNLYTSDTSEGWGVVYHSGRSEPDPILEDG